MEIHCRAGCSRDQNLLTDLTFESEQRFAVRKLI
jgi:hypothetical protein